MSIIQTLNEAVALHQRGDLAGAERLYRQVLADEPRNSDAWHLLGMIAAARGNPRAAVEAISRAIVVDGGQPLFHQHLAEALRAMGKLAEAEASCRQAIRLKEDVSAAHNTLGLIQNQQGRPAEAAASFRRAIELEPALATARANLAVALGELGQPDEALAACREAIARDPALPLAWQELGRILREQGRVEEAIDLHRRALAENPRLAAAEFSLGNLLRAEARPLEAIACYERAIALEGSFAESHANLAATLADLGHAHEAEQHYRKALAANPRLAEVHYNLGALLQNERRAAEAFECYQQALALKPDHAKACNNLGMLYQMRGDLPRARELYSRALEHAPNFAGALGNLGSALKLAGRLEEAGVAYDQALRIAPDAPQARFNRALLLLSAGELAVGWQEYEWRLQCPEFRPRAFGQPRWRGESLPTSTLLVHAEQGLGESMHFARYLPLVAERVGKVVFQCQPALVPLLKQSGFEQYAVLVALDDPLPSFDAFVPLLSLPGTFGTTLANIPGASGYLAADPALVEHWRGVLGDRPPCRVGIVWQGAPSHPEDRFRSIPLAEFAPLAQSGVELISLQKGFGTEQLAGQGGRFGVRELGDELDTAHGPFMDTAAVMKHLDLVITADTAVAALAGGLGVEAWVALALVPDWRWMHARDDSPWYASLRLFRQTALGDWADVFARMAQALGQRFRLAGR